MQNAFNPLVPSTNDSKMSTCSATRWLLIDQIQVANNASNNQQNIFKKKKQHLFAIHSFTSWQPQVKVLTLALAAVVVVVVVVVVVARKIHCYHQKQTM